MDDMDKTLENKVSALPHPVANSCAVSSEGGRNPFHCEPGISWVAKKRTPSTASAVIGDATFSAMEPPRLRPPASTRASPRHNGRPLATRDSCLPPASTTCQISKLFILPKSLLFWLNLQDNCQELDTRTDIDWDGASKWE